MTLTDAHASTQARWLAVTSVAVGTFTIVTSEMLPVGLLTSIASDLRVSDGTAGLMMTAPGLVAAVAAPLLAVTTRRVDRRVTLLGLMALLAVANLAGALSQSHAVMMAARVLTGVSIGGFWAFAAGLAPRLVPGRSVGRATSIILSGVSVASVLGVPAATFVSSFAGWRSAFIAMGAVALVLLAVLAATLPPLPGDPPPAEDGPTAPARPRHERTPAQDTLTTAQNALQSPQSPPDDRNALQGTEPGARPGTRPAWLSRPLRLVLVLTVLIVSGHFAAYTYVRPFMEQVSHAGPALISTALLVYGAAGVAGNFASGALAARNPRPVLIALAALMALATAALPVIGLPLAVLVVWGLGYGGVGVALQLWIMREGGGELGTALFVSAFNVSIALGAFAGGRVVDGVSIIAVMWLAAGLTALGAVVAGIWGRSRTTGS
ncbi:MFS transporter [Nonomuraea diastatica]|uniref:MFS transporter n=1 Tax=Nonomuraea diastatica TaxID=1848329 RepID=A0A4R4X7N5_9ACTN|nr:MFS transporter [Nonomuraea diastatica]TDD26448.1 MFS transporter [Nonomuraea diastatica]